MDFTVRKVNVFKVFDDGTSVRLLAETVGGTTVILDIVQEGILDMVLTLMLARTQAIIKAEGDFPVSASEDRMVMHSLFPTAKMIVVKEANPTMRRVQMLTHEGAIFEFLVAADQIEQQTMEARPKP